MYSYDVDALLAAFSEILEKQLTSESREWLLQKSAELSGPRGKMALNITFTSLPRKVGKQPVEANPSVADRLQKIRKELRVQHWTIDRLSRAWLLLQIPAQNKEAYIDSIEGLFLAAEMHELVALYSALPLLAYPEAWKLRCAEGIRSNIGDVLEAIMCDNPYPSEYLDEPAWNQLVLKAIFTEKPLNRIIGIDERANRVLANTLSDFAHERWAAHRPVPPMLWRCVGPYINEKIYPDIEKLATSDNQTEREAAALACSVSSYPGAVALLKDNRALAHLLQSGEVSWESIAKKEELV